MFRYIAIVFLAPLFINAAVQYHNASKAYDPAKVCAEQTRTTESSCLAQVHFAQSGAGW